MFERARKKARMAEEFLRGTPSPHAPSTLRDFGLQRIMARASRARDEATGKRYLRHPARLRRAVAVPLLTLLLMAGATSGLYAASSGALPGSPLYGSKIFFERARLALTPSPSSDAGLEMEFCERRMRELQGMLQDGGSHDWERWLREYRRNLSRVELLLESLPDTESRSLSLSFESMLSEHVGFLELMSTEAPEESRPFLEVAHKECHGSMMRMRRRCGMEGGDAHPQEQQRPGNGGDDSPDLRQEGQGDPQEQQRPGCGRAYDSGHGKGAP
ncbi:MAG: DUF5667 domain-containing protein [Actinomycetota bacterium]|nr:DUF5667 domain-containing protein [Actinomycetota bacterium]MDI7252277.1 DUF5667 domain-containing protein [Actinomycetota bacterium]